MGGIGLGCLQPQPNTTHTYAHTYTIHTHTPANIYMHLHNNTTQQYPDIPVHKQTQYPDTERNTEQNIEHSTENSAHNYRTYSLDYYNEYAVIKNSNTIELYTISKD